MATVTLADDLKPLHHPKTWIGKYVWSQDHKVIAIQYSLTAIAIGLVALVLSVLMRLQLGFPDTFHFIQPENYLQFVTMHGMIMVVYLLTALLLGGFGNYLIPLMVGARDMVFPYRQHAQLLGLSARGAGAGGELLRAGRTDRRGLDALPAADHPRRDARQRIGHHPDAGRRSPSSSSPSRWAGSTM